MGLGSRESGAGTSGNGSVSGDKGRLFVGQRSWVSSERGGRDRYGVEGSEDAVQWLKPHTSPACPVGDVLQV